MARAAKKMPKRNKRNFRPTKSGAGMTKKGVAAYHRANPGSKLKTAVTVRLKKEVQRLRDESRFVLVLTDSVKCTTSTVVKRLTNEFVKLVKGGNADG